MAWRRLAESINALIDRMQVRQKEPLSTGEDLDNLPPISLPSQDENFSKAQAELEELRQAYDQVMVQNQALNHQNEELSRDKQAIQAEFGRAFELIPRERSLVLFLGSNIGNLDHAEAVRFLRALRGHTLLVGLDMQKDPALLSAAYDDAQGVTAAFNLNLLARINRELGGDFDLAGWRHLALYNAAAGRVEMHLVSAGAQSASILGERHVFEAGERIHTENSYKFSEQQIRAIAAESGLRVENRWTDDRGWFSVALLT